MRRSGSKEPHIQQATVILTAIEEVVADRTQANAGAFPSATVYFGAIMSSLEQKHKQTDDSLTAFMYLLAMLFPQVPVGVLHAKLDAISGLFVELASLKHDQTLLAKSVLSCCGVLLRSLERPMWANQHALNMLKPLLISSLDPRPKLRKQSQTNVTEVLASLGGHEMGTPKQVVELVVRLCKREMAQCTPKQCHVALYLCGLLQQCIFYLPSSSMVGILQPIFNLASAGTAILRVQLYRTLSALFNYDIAFGSQEEKEAGEEETKEDSRASITNVVRVPRQGNVADLLRKLLKFLPNLKPHAEDAQSSGPYNACVVAALRCMTRLDSLSVGPFLPQYFELVAQDLLSAKPEVSQKSLPELKKLLKHCVTPALVAQAVGHVGSEKPAVVLLLELAEGLLSYKYKHTWSKCMSVQGVLLAALDPSAAALAQPLLLALNALRESKQHEDESAFKEVFGAAIASLSPAGLLAALPLNPDKSNVAAVVQQGRWWLLPLLGNSVQAPSLAYWAGDLLPLAEALQQVLNSVKDTHKKEAFTITDLIASLWATFPAFCTDAIDTATAFKPLAKKLGEILSNPDLALVWPHVSRGVYNLVKSAQDKQDAASLTVLTTYAKNFLPIFFNIVSKTESSRRATYLRTIELLVTLCDRKLCNTLFKKVLAKLLAETAETNAEHDDHAEAFKASHCLSDIVLCMCPNLDEENLSFLYRTVGPQLTADDGILQKKAYKIISCACEKHAAFFESHWKEIIAHVANSMVACKPAALKHRLKCLKTLLLRVPNLLQHQEIAAVLPTLLGEAILTIKEVNRKARDTAYDLLTSLGRHLLGQGQGEAVMQEYIVMLMAGLAGNTPRMQSASVLALSRMVYELKTDLQEATLQEVLLMVMLLLKEKSREVVKSVLGFVKVCLIVLPAEAVQTNLKLLIEGLTIWCAESKNRFRQKVKGLFELLVKKFDSELIKSMVPSHYVRLIEHIRKCAEREAKRKAEAREKWLNNKGKKEEATKDFERLLEDDGDDSGEDEMPAAGAGGKKPTQKKTKKEKAAEKAAEKVAKKDKAKGSQMWIKDDVDLLGSDVHQNVVTSDPAKRMLQQAATGLVKRDRQVVEGADGRFIIDPSKSRGKWAAMADAKDEGEGGAMADDEEQKEARPEYGKKRRRGGDEQADTKRRKDQSGERFRAKKAGGDMKGKGGVMPYAFLALDPAQLNRRKRDQASNSFESVISAAKKGAKKGTKAHSRAAGNRNKKSRKK